MRRFAVLTCSLPLLLVASTARADSIYIRGGYYVLGSTGDSYRFEVPNPFVAGYGTVFDGSASSVDGISWLTCLVCDPGQTYAIARHTDGPGFLGKADMGTATEVLTTPTGTFTYQYSMAGWLTFLADPITLPAAGTSSVSFAVPFRARVSFEGFSLDGSGGGVFTRWLGTGTAHVTFTPTGDGRWANVGAERLRYEFSAQPVPEPATMFLIGTGLAALAARRMRRPA